MAGPPGPAIVIGNRVARRYIPMENTLALLAIIRAARAIGDRDLERAAKSQLRDEYGIEVTFRRRREVCHA
jgi:hypothetical protein